MAMVLQWPSATRQPAQMSHVFHRDTRVDLPVAVAGEGVYLIDNDGKRYLDASGGAAVSCLGHNDAEVRAAIVQQVQILAYAHTGFFTTDVMEELADTLAADAPTGLERVYFVSGGSEAMEAALKLARQYFVEAGQPNRRHFVARSQSYHGNTLGALSVGGNLARRKTYQPLLVPPHHISSCYAYRGQAQGESPDEYGLRVADKLEAVIKESEPDSIIAFVAEPVVGATLGAVPATPGYLKRVREICDRYGVLLILDEVMCGMGCTGTLHACTQDDVVPDMVVVAKGLGAGYQPIGAVLVSNEIYQTIHRGSGAFMHGHTYMGHATACAAALAVQNAIKNRNLLANVRQQGQLFRRLLDERLGDHPHVGDIRGRGLFIGVELVADRGTKVPFDSGIRLHALIKSTCMENGLICYPNSGCVDGVSGDHVLFAPPFIVTAEQISDIVDRFAEALNTALAKAFP